MTSAGRDDQRSGQEVAGMSTWGISGPRFLLLYLVLLAVTVLGVVLARRRVLATGDGAAVPARLGPYEAAELNGGGDLVLVTAASNALRGGSLVNASRRRGQPARLVTGPPPIPRPIRSSGPSTSRSRPVRTGGSRTCGPRWSRRRRWPR
jgi:hypothetical protein